MSIQRRRAYLAWLAVCVVWSTTFLAIRIGVETLPPLTVVSGARYLVAGLVLGAFVRLSGVPLPSRDSWPGHALLGTLMLGVGNGALVWAEQSVPSGTAAVMVAAIPFWMLGIEALLPTGERVRPWQWMGLLLGFAGLVLLVSANLGLPSGPGGRAFLHGALALQVSCCGWALGSAYSKRHARHENALAAASMQMVFGGLVLIAAGMLLGEGHSLPWSLRGGLAWGYLVVFGAIIGYASYTYALKYLSVATVSLYAYITPVLALLLGTVFMHEPFTTRTAVAIVIIFTGMVIVRQASDTSRN